MIKPFLIVGVCASALTGCYQQNTSQAPIASTYPSTYQQKMQAAHHWDVLAGYEATLIAQSLKGRNLLVHIPEDELATSFKASYRNLLTSQLVKNNISVSTKPTGALTISYKVDLVEHQDQDAIRAPAGSWTLLSAGVAVAAHAIHKWTPEAKLLIPAAMVADIYSGNWVDETETEVIITTQVTEGSRIIHSSSNIYYINDGDKGQYKNKMKRLKEISVSDQE